MFPLIPMLASAGLNLLTKAIETKGRGVVEGIIGQPLPSDSTMPLSEAELVKLKEAEMLHEEALLQLNIEAATNLAKIEQDAQDNVTRRWEADTQPSATSLSKNIRPYTLIFLLTAFVIFALLSSFGVEIGAAYSNMLEQFLTIVMTAYFVGRTIEKIKGITND